MQYGAELRAAYEALQHDFRSEGRELEIEPFEIVETVQKYREAWKPETVQTVLLAESHVFTSWDDFQIRLDRSRFPASDRNEPESFVRFIYCVGYGDNDLLERTPNISNKRGTKGFWRIFIAARSNPHGPQDSSQSSTEYERALEAVGSKDVHARYGAKVAILDDLRRAGIWLLDASVFGVYKPGAKKDAKLVRRAIDISWRHVVGPIIEDVKPRRILFIGKTVFDQLREGVAERGVAEADYVEQPTAWSTGRPKKLIYDKVSQFCFRP